MGKVDDREEIGIGGFTAFARVREQETITASAPSTPLEDGSLAHDHIIINPLQLNIEGRVADIHVKPRAEVTLFRRGLAEIGNISKYLPARTRSQINRAAALVVTVDNYAQKLKAVIADGRQAFEFFGSKDPEQNNREKFLEMLNEHYDDKELIQIETRSQVYERMVITSRVISRDNTTDDSLDFKITAQQLRFAEVIYTDIQKHFKSPAPGDAGDQTKGQESKGLNDAPEVETSLATSLKETISGVF